MKRVGKLETHNIYLIKLLTKKVNASGSFLLTSNINLLVLPPTVCKQRSTKTPFLS